MLLRVPNRKAHHHAPQEEFCKDQSTTKAVLNRMKLLGVDV